MNNVSIHDRHHHQSPNYDDPCEKCKGETLSNCCGSEIEPGYLCSCCKEHCENQCSDCEIINPI